MGRDDIDRYDLDYAEREAGEKPAQRPGLALHWRRLEVRLKLGQRDIKSAVVTKLLVDRQAGLLKDQARATLLLDGLEQLQQYAHFLGVTHCFEHNAARQRAGMVVNEARIHQLERGVHQSGAEGSAAAILDRLPELALTCRRVDLPHQLSGVGSDERRQPERLRNELQLAA
eukprot:scaffold15442_cov63-Phaeocystis_antarctica.AAC.2